MIRILVSILMRQARANAPMDPASWLTALQTTKWASASASNGMITGTTVNGKTVTIAASGGFSIADILVASEIALQRIENGITGPMGRTQAVLN